MKKVPLTKQIKQRLGGLRGWMKAHPVQTAGYGLTGAMNLGGLFDNDKLLGQLAGAASGFGISQIPAVSGFLESNNINPTLVAMSGGALGSLFDKLRAKEERENTYDGLTPAEHDALSYIAYML